jgi:hypothetical protein
MKGGWAGTWAGHPGQRRTRSFPETARTAPGGSDATSLLAVLQLPFEPDGVAAVGRSWPCFPYERAPSA